MIQLVNLEKRFENALEKLELALANKSVSEGLSIIEQEDKVVKEENGNCNDLLIRIRELEKAAQSDAEEIDKLVNKLKQIFEIDND